MPVQTTFNETIRAGIPGMINRMVDFNTITRLAPWKMAHPRSNDAYLVTANRKPCRNPRSHSTSSAADRRILDVEHEHAQRLLEGGGSP